MTERELLLAAAESMRKGGFSTEEQAQNAARWVKLCELIEMSLWTIFSSEYEIESAQQLADDIDAELELFA